MKVTIDRFEGDFAVVEYETGKTANMPKVLLDSTAKEGDIIEISLLSEETKERKNRISLLRQKLEKNKET